MLMEIGMKVNGGCFRLAWFCVKSFKLVLSIGTWLTKRFRITHFIAMILMCCGNHDICSNQVHTGEIRKASRSHPLVFFTSWGLQMFVKSLVYCLFPLAPGDFCMSGEVVGERKRCVASVFLAFWVCLKCKEEKVLSVCFAL